MFAMVGIALLLVVRWLHLPDLFAALVPVPLVPIVAALALFGLVVDLRLRKSQLTVAPQLGFALAFAAWTLGRLAYQQPPGARADAADFAAAFALYFLIAQGVQRFRGLALVAGLLLALTLGGGVVALLPSSPLGPVLDDSDAGMLALALAVPLAFAFWERTRSPARLFLSILTLILAALCVIVTRSRAGQVALAAVLVVHFALRLGPRGLAVAVLLAAPLFAFGGRVELVRARTAAIPGLVLAALVLYLSLKAALVLLRRYRDDVDAAVAYVWARALLAALAGLTAGSLFVAPGTHDVFWIYTGLAGALYQAARAHDPQLRRLRCL